MSKKKTYLFRPIGTEEIVEWEMTQQQYFVENEPFAPLRRVILPDGREAERAVAEEMRRERPASAGRQKKRAWARPLLSDAMGVHPDQVKEASEYYSSRLGRTQEFTSDGRAVVTGPAHRKALAEAMGLHDRNGGYGDPQHNG